jgi:hypothetical protein
VPGHAGRQRGIPGCGQRSPGRTRDAGNTGNSELLTPGIRRAAAELLGAPVERVALEWIGHHYHVVYHWMELEQVEPLDPDSFHLRVLLDGDDVSSTS